MESSSERAAFNGKFPKCDICGTRVRDGLPCCRRCQSKWRVIRDKAYNDALNTLRNCTIGGKHE